jgi:transcriptional regulator with PAS, ATPase and Fis domain
MPTALEKNRPFLTLNCGALAENLLESELFGHAKGAFTGAVAQKKGLFEEAEGGTLFLDEIGDISQQLQVKLLRLIQEGEFKPVGSNEVRRVETRILAATHRNLEKMVKEGTFREDLYYRLKVITIELPPLRERKEDIPLLVNHLIHRLLRKMNRPSKKISREALDLILEHSWPGNIRELEHVLEQAIVMSHGMQIEVEDLSIGREMDFTQDKKAAYSTTERALKSLGEVEEAHIRNVLSSVNYNRSKASQVLGIDRVTLYRKAKLYGIDLPKTKAKNDGGDKSLEAWAKSGY